MNQVWCVPRVPRKLVALAAALLVGGVALAQPSSQPASEFEVGVGYLSTGVGELVEQHGWELVWKAGEDRMVEFPFSVRVPAGSREDALRGALANLLDAFEGQFVADMYRGNRVVVIDVAPPNTQAVRPRALDLVSVDPEPDAEAEGGEGEED